MRLALPQLFEERCLLARQCPTVSKAAVNKPLLIPSPRTPDSPLMVYKTETGHQQKREVHTVFI